MHFGEWKTPLCIHLINAEKELFCYIRVVIWMMTSCYAIKLKPLSKEGFFVLCVFYAIH